MFPETAQCQGPGAWTPPSWPEFCSSWKLPWPPEPQPGQTPSSCPAQRLASAKLHQLFSALGNLNCAEDLTEAKGVSARQSTAGVGPPAGKKPPPSPGVSHFSPLPRVGPIWAEGREKHPVDSTPRGCLTGHAPPLCDLPPQDTYVHVC